MIIKLKNKDLIAICSSTNTSETTCKWCGKTIKANKTYFWSATGGVSSACSAAHVKAAANAAL
jgi:hypothetical protein